MSLGGDLVGAAQFEMTLENEARAKAQKVLFTMKGVGFLSGVKGKGKAFNFL